MAARHYSNKSRESIALEAKQIQQHGRESGEREQKRKDPEDRVPCEASVGED